MFPTVHFTGSLINHHVRVLDVALFEFGAKNNERLTPVPVTYHSSRLLEYIEHMVVCSLAKFILFKN